MMDSDASSGEEYGQTELDQLIQDEFFDSSNSDEEVDMMMLVSMKEEMDPKMEDILNFKGSIKRRRFINRDRVFRAKLLQKDCFDPEPTFPDHTFFHRRFLEAHDDYFKLTRDCCGQLSFSGKQKYTAAMRMFALGTAADAIGKMVRIGESTCLKTTIKFARAVVEVFEAEYVRESNAHDTKKLLAIGEARGFSGMLGSIDCMH
ncbi:hypothetical protein ZWY2020_029745 [Hordeum vulgare]|nr:hypothetical protein ZWY2020_029745 [Hordeum vulgare]